MPAYLTFFPSGQPSRRVFLDPSRTYSIGRNRSCDLQFDELSLSRRHARLRFKDGAWQVRDLDSKNGTAIGGRHIQQARLEKGNWISFGDMLAEFTEISAEARRAESSREALRWQTSQEMLRHLDPSTGLEPLLTSVLRSVLSMSGTQRGFIMLADAAGDLEIAACEGLSAEDVLEHEFTGSVGALRAALAGGHLVVTGDALTHSLLEKRPSIAQGEIRALVCIPLKVGNDIIGAIYADSREPGKVFNELDADILGALGEHAALAIGAARVHKKLSRLGDFKKGLDSSAQRRVLAESLSGRIPVFRDNPNIRPRARTWSEVLARHRFARGEPAAS